MIENFFNFKNYKKNICEFEKNIGIYNEISKKENFDLKKNIEKEINLKKIIENKEYNIKVIFVKTGKLFAKMVVIC
jgi:hypothetical protein